MRLCARPIILRMTKRKVRRAAASGCLGLCLVLAYALWRFGPTLADAYRAGFFDKQPDRRYSGSTMANLKALYIAMMLYHDSEEGFPPANAWMDRIESRLRTADMSKEEASKKLRDPALGSDPTVYGYAMNQACGGKYKMDVGPASTVLLFTSKDTRRNANGDPSRDAPASNRPGGNLAITLAGSVLQRYAAH